MKWKTDLSLFPFYRELASLGVSTLRRDLSAAFAVALLAIPQAIAYSLLAGLPPIAGLISAIFGAIFSSAFGSCRQLICGPTTATAILIQTTLSELLRTHYGDLTGLGREMVVLQLLTQIVLVVGVLQILLSLCNVAKILNFVSRPVILGYFAGIGIIVFVQQLYGLLGIPSVEGSVFTKVETLFSHPDLVRPATLVLGSLCLFSYVFLRKRFPHSPYGLIIFCVAGVLAWVCNADYLSVGHVATLHDFGLEESAHHVWMAPYFDLQLLNRIFPGAAAIALLSVLEVFSVSRTVGVRTGCHPLANQEVFGVGIGNLVLGLISGCLPSSGSPSRSILNVEMGAMSRYAGIFSGLFVAGIVFLFWPTIGYIPIAALAALLIATVPTFLDLKETRICLRATREDSYVFLITFFSSLLFTLEIAFFIGICVSIATYLKKSSVPHVVEYAFNPAGRLYTIARQQIANRRVRIIGVSGELFFAVAEELQATLHSIAKDPYVKAIVLRLHGVYHMDASMCLAILHLHDVLKTSQRHLLISGLSQEVMQVLYRAGLVDVIGKENFFVANETEPQQSTWKACQRASEF